MALLETEELSKQFMRGGRAFKVLDKVDFSIKQGDFIHIVGRSGSGKTTFLNLLAGLLNPTSGKVLVDGRELTSMSDEERSIYRNSFIGYVPQLMGTMANFTVLENVKLPHFLFKREGNGTERAAMLLDMMGLLELKDEYPKSLSGGEIKRVLLSRALMNNPRVLIADEPTADLDKKTTVEIMELLKKINKKGTSLIVVTHELDLLKYGNKILTMKNGRFVENFNNEFSLS